MILARTIKGKGISFMEGKGGWHGKPLKKGEEVEKALAELKSQFVPEDDEHDVRRGGAPAGASTVRMPRSRSPGAASRNGGRFPATSSATSVATREAYGDALARLGDSDDRIVALDADVKNSTFSDKFEQRHPGPLLPEASSPSR